MSEHIEKINNIKKLLRSDPAIRALTLVKIKTIEGRRHQIRAHMQIALSTPIVFDETYGFSLN